MMQRKPYTVRPMQTPAPHTFHTFHGLVCGTPGASAAHRRRRPGRRPRRKLPRGGPERRPWRPCLVGFVLANGDLAPETVQSFAAPDDLADHVRAETAGGGIDCIAASPDADPALAGAGLPVHILDPGLIDRDALPRFAPVAVRDPGLPRRMALAGAGAVALLALVVENWRHLIGRCRCPA